MNNNFTSAFNLPSHEKKEFIVSKMNELTNIHYNNCGQYNKLVETLWRAKTKADHLEDIPFLPVRLFKTRELLSVPRETVIKTMTSSGTTGQQVSKIFLDKETSALQTKILAEIVGNFIGKQRLPMLVIDSKATVSNRYKFSARTAGILGFSMFGRKVEFALDDKMNLDYEKVDEFLSKYSSENLLVFGFTFIIWRHLIRVLERDRRSIALDNGVMLHGGGWKQLLSESVDNKEFKKRLSEVSGLRKVHNYYGMVEQTGSIFMECEEGYLHCSDHSEILIRDPESFSILPNKKIGLIQLCSVIPKGYPGHSLLSEDIGEIVGVDDCKCGRLGKYFLIHGRMKEAEVRGCSDTYSA